MSEINHRIVETNGIRMHIAEQGKGPLVILCHGFPELWYSWRHQLPALAKAGFHAVAPDQRGYGQTDKPAAIEAYNIFQLVGDIVGLVHALGEEKAVIVGHDWGAPVAWHCALLRPDIFRALGLMSVPYGQRSWTSIRPTDGMKKMAGEKEFYQLYFQPPGKAEVELEEDVKKTLTMILYTLSGDSPPEKRGGFLFDKSTRLIDNFYMPDKLPTWLTEADIEVFAGEYKKSGFRGGINWYRNMDRNWEYSAFMNGEKIQQPSIFIAGEEDGVIAMERQNLGTLNTTMTGLRKQVIVPGAGHWIQQERPDEVNKLLIEFLAAL